MGNLIKDEDDFYIGWLPQAPSIFARKSRQFLYLLALVIPLVATTLVLTQKGFIPSVFEFGQISEVEGFLIKYPIPQLKVPEGIDGKKNPVFKTILLVGLGKKGAETYLDQMEKKLGQSLHQKSVVLRGTLIYYDGKTLLELSEDSDPLTAGFARWSDKKIDWKTKSQLLGQVKLRGEIYDPKCALGVMKPGNGKPHRSCAIRCISGGIPPILQVANAAGKANYFLMLGPQGQTINEAVLDFVGDQVQICGRLEQQDDWLVLYTDPSSDLLRLQPHWMEGDIRLCSQSNSLSYLQHQ